MASQEKPQRGSHRGGRGGRGRGGRVRKSSMASESSEPSPLSPTLPPKPSLLSRIEPLPSPITPKSPASPSSTSSPKNPRNQRKRKGSATSKLATTTTTATIENDPVNVNSPDTPSDDPPQSILVPEPTPTLPIVVEDTLVDRLKAVTLDPPPSSPSPRPYTPMGRDWAGEDDNDSLPSLDDWGMPGVKATSEAGDKEHSASRISAEVSITIAGNPISNPSLATNQTTSSTIESPMDVLNVIPPSPVTAVPQRGGIRHAAANLPPIPTIPTRSGSSTNLGISPLPSPGSLNPEGYYISRPNSPGNASPRPTSRSSSPRPPRGTSGGVLLGVARADGSNSRSQSRDRSGSNSNGGPHNMLNAPYLNGSRPASPNPQTLGFPSSPLPGRSGSALSWRQDSATGTPSVRQDELLSSQVPSTPPPGGSLGARISDSPTLGHSIPAVHRGGYPQQRGNFRGRRGGHPSPLHQPHRNPSFVPQPNGSLDSIHARPRRDSSTASDAGSTGGGASGRGGRGGGGIGHARSASRPKIDASAFSLVNAALSPPKRSRGGPRTEADS